jgi:hypothetical protein
MREAARMWAVARRAGRPTATEAALDADVILAAQALVASDGDETSVVVATTNAKHLKRYVPARSWRSIVP